MAFEIAHQELSAAHDAYWRTWNLGFQSARADDLARFFAEEFVSLFRSKSMSHAQTIGRADYLDGCRETLASLGPAARWITDSVVIEMRSAEEGLVIERATIQHPRGQNVALMLEVWRRVNGEWKLARTDEEVR
jgi:hypothetical protein